MPFFRKDRQAQFLDWLNNLYEDVFNSWKKEQTPLSEITKFLSQNTGFYQDISDAYSRSGLKANGSDNLKKFFNLNDQIFEKLRKLQKVIWGVHAILPSQEDFISDPNSKTEIQRYHGELKTLYDSVFGSKGISEEGISEAHFFQLDLYEKVDLLLAEIAAIEQDILQYQDEFDTVYDQVKEDIDQIYNQKVKALAPILQKLKQFIPKDVQEEVKEISEINRLFEYSLKYEFRKFKEEFKKQFTKEDFEKENIEKIRAKIQDSEFLKNFSPIFKSIILHELDKQAEGNLEAQFSAWVAKAKQYSDFDKLKTILYPLKQDKSADNLQQLEQILQSIEALETESGKQIKLAFQKKKPSQFKEAFPPKKKNFLEKLKKHLHNKIKPDYDPTKKLPEQPYILGKTLFMDAAERGDLNLLKYLVKQTQQANKSVPNILDEQDSFGNTALHLAAREGHSAVIHYLQEQGADSRKKNIQGKIPADLMPMPELEDMRPKTQNLHARQFHIQTTGFFPGSLKETFFSVISPFLQFKCDTRGKNPYQLKINDKIIHEKNDIPNLLETSDCITGEVYQIKEHNTHEAHYEKICDITVSESTGKFPNQPAEKSRTIQAKIESNVDELENFENILLGWPKEVEILLQGGSPSQQKNLILAAYRLDNKNYFPKTEISENLENADPNSYLGRIKIAGDSDNTRLKEILHEVIQQEKSSQAKTTTVFGRMRQYFVPTATNKQSTQASLNAADKFRNKGKSGK